MKTNWLFPAATLLVGVAGGYIAGHGPSAPQGSAADTSAPKTRSERSAASADDRAAVSRPRDIADIRRTPGQLNRIQSLMEFYASLKSSYFESETKKLSSLPFQQRIM